MNFTAATTQKTKPITLINMNLSIGLSHMNQLIKDELAASLKATDEMPRINLSWNKIGYYDGDYYYSKGSWDSRELKMRIEWLVNDEDFLFHVKSK